MTYFIVALLAYLIGRRTRRIVIQHRYPLRPDDGSYVVQQRVGAERLDRMFDEHFEN